MAKTLRKALKSAQIIHVSEQVEKALGGLCGQDACETKSSSPDPRSEAAKTLREMITERIKQRRESANDMEVALNRLPAGVADLSMETLNHCGIYY